MVPLLQIIWHLYSNFLLKVDETATVIKDRKEFVPEYALHKYTFKQLGDHLCNKHSREQLIVVAVRAVAFPYRGALEEVKGV